MKWINGIVTALLVAVSSYAFSEVVLETDDSVATKTGTWTASTSIAGYYGTGFATAAAAGGADVMRFLSPRAPSRRPAVGAFKPIGLLLPIAPSQ